jgi:cytochrome c biogenesis protein CcmG/thiol:disulfide interchange protein DsbE
MGIRGHFSLKRNTIVLGITLFILAVFAWAGWANWEYRKQAAAKAAASAVQGQLAAGETADAMYTSSPLLGKPAPDFTLQDLNGNKVSLDAYQGKALLINFWATWCGPCKLETPWLVELSDEYAGKGFVILGIDAEDDEVTPDDKAGWAKDRALVARFVKQERMPYPVLMGGDSISKTYGGLDAMPTSFWVDRTGKVIAAQMGITSKDDMESKIKTALGQ